MRGAVLPLFHPRWSSVTPEGSPTRLYANVLRADGPCDVAAGCKAGAPGGSAGAPEGARAPCESGVFEEGIRSPYESEGDPHSEPRLCESYAATESEAQSAQLARPSSPGDSAVWGARGRQAALAAAGGVTPEALVGDAVAKGGWRESIGEEDGPMGCELTPPLGDAQVTPPQGEALAAPQQATPGVSVSIDLGHGVSAACESVETASARKRAGILRSSLASLGGGLAGLLGAGAAGAAGVATGVAGAAVAAVGRRYGGADDAATPTFGEPPEATAGRAESHAHAEAHHVAADEVAAADFTYLPGDESVVAADTAYMGLAAEESACAPEPADTDARAAAARAAAGIEVMLRDHENGKLSREENDDVVASSDADDEQQHSDAALPASLEALAAADVAVTPEATHFSPVKLTPAIGATTPYERAAFAVLQSVGKAMRASVDSDISEELEADDLEIEVDDRHSNEDGLSGESAALRRARESAYFAVPPTHVPPPHRLAASDAATRAAVGTALSGGYQSGAARDHAMRFLEDDGAALRRALALDGPLLDADGNHSDTDSEASGDPEVDLMGDAGGEEAAPPPHPKVLRLEVRQMRGAVLRKRTLALAMRKTVVLEVSLGAGEVPVASSAPLRWRGAAPMSLELAPEALEYLVPPATESTDMVAAPVNGEALAASIDEVRVVVEGGETQHGAMAADLAADLATVSASHASLSELLAATRARPPRGVGLRVALRVEGAAKPFATSVVPWASLRALLAARADGTEPLHTLRFSRAGGDADGDFAGEAALEARVSESEVVGEEAADEVDGPAQLEHALADAVAPSGLLAPAQAISASPVTVGAHEAYDALLAAALHASAVGEKKLRLGSPWVWLCAAVAQRFDVTPWYQSLRYAAHCLGGFASHSAECMGLLEELLVPALEAAAEGTLPRRERALLSGAKAAAADLCDRALAAYRTRAAREQGSLRSLRACLRLRERLGTLGDADTSLKAGAEALWRELTARAARATSDSSTSAAAGNVGAPRVSEGSVDAASLSDVDDTASLARPSSPGARVDGVAQAADRLGLLAGAVASEVRNDLAVEGVVAGWDDVPAARAPNFARVAGAVLGGRLCAAARTAAAAAAEPAASPAAIAASVRAAVALRECRIALAAWGLPGIVLDGIDAYGAAVRAWTAGLSERLVRAATTAPPPPARRGAALAERAAAPLPTAGGGGCLRFVEDAYHGFVDGVAPLAPVAATWPGDVFPALGRAAADIDKAALETLVAWWASARQNEASLTAAESLRAAAGAAARAMRGCTACATGSPPPSPRSSLAERCPESALVRDRFRLVTPARAAYVNSLKHMLEGARRSVSAALKMLAEGAPSDDCALSARAAAAAAASQLGASALTLEGLYAGAVTELEDEVARAALGGGGSAMAAALAEMGALLEESPEAFARLRRGSGGGRQGSVAAHHEGLPPDMDDAVAPLAGALAPRVFKEVCRGVWARCAQALRAALYNGGIGPTRGVEAAAAGRRSAGDVNPKAAAALLDKMTAYYRRTLEAALGKEMRPDDGREPAAARELRKVLQRVAGGSEAAHTKHPSRSKALRGSRGVLSPGKGQHHTHAGHGRRGSGASRRSSAGLTPCKELLDSVRATAAADPSSWLEAAPSEDKGKTLQALRMADSRENVRPGNGPDDPSSYVKRWREISTVDVSQSVALS